MGIPTEVPKDPSRPNSGHSSMRGVVLQMVTAVALSMTHFCMAASTSITGVFAEQMTSPENITSVTNYVMTNTTSDIILTKDEISWISATYNIGTMIGFLLSSYVNPRVGTLRLLQINAPLNAGAWVLMGLGGSFPVILSGRILSGVAIGTCLGPTITHMGEISSVKLRSGLTSFMVVVGVSGIVFSNLFGWLLGWRHSCLVIGTVPMILQFLIILPLPRSARWLISKGYPQEEAERSLRFYMGHDHDVTGEIADIKKSLGDSHRHDASLLQVLATLRYRHHLVPLLIVISMYWFFVFSGGLTASSFAPVIFKSAGGLDNPYIGGVLVGTVRMATTIVTTVLIDKVARRTLLMFNGGVGLLGCLATGLYFFYKESLVDYGWIPLVSILAIVCAMSWGISPLMNVMFSELLPNAIRAEASGINLVVFGASNFTMVYSFPLAAEAIGLGGVFFSFAFIHFLMILFGRFCLPETRGRSIEQIQKLFVKSTVQDTIIPVDIGGAVDAKELEVTSPDVV